MLYVLFRTSMTTLKSFVVGSIGPNQITCTVHVYILQVRLLASHGNGCCKMAGIWEEMSSSFSDQSQPVVVKNERASVQTTTPASPVSY